MDLVSLLDQIRGYNVTALRSAASQCPGAFLEPALCNDAGEVVGEGQYDLPVRVDLVLVEDTVPTEKVMVSPDKALSFTAFDAIVNGLPVRISPFGWDYAHVRAHTPDSSLDFGKLCAWFFGWFDIEDTHDEDGDGLYGVVHYMSDPKLTPSGFSFVVDLGSAPVDALVSLMAALKDMGATRVEVG